MKTLVILMSFTLFVSFIYIVKDKELNKNVVIVNKSPLEGTSK